MKIHYVSGRGYDSNIYVVTGEIPTIIDTGTGLNYGFVKKKIEEILSLDDVKQIVLTHEHFDHVGGVKLFFDSIDGPCRVFAHKNAVDKIENGDSDFASLLGGEMPKISVDVKLDAGDTLVLGDEEFLVYHTPGHTPGCICLYNESNGILFSGDTVFSHGSFGRYDFPGGDPRLLRQSIERLSHLDVKNLYPGHESIVEGDGNRHMQLTLKNSSYLL